MKIRLETDPIEAYDLMAPTYDESYRRPVDLAENRLLKREIGAYLDGRSVVDLACGTGFLLELARPSWYLGVDGSPQMLDRLHDKFPDAEVRLADLRSPYLERAWMPAHKVEVVCCLFAASYLPLLRWLQLARKLLQPGGILILHGYTQRYRNREHYALHGLYHPEWVTDRWRLEAQVAGFPDARLVGLNILCDGGWLPLPMMGLSPRLPYQWSLHAALIGHYLD